MKLMRGQGAEDIRSDDEDEAPKSPGQSKDREKQPYSRTPEGVWGATLVVTSALLVVTRSY